MSLYLTRYIYIYFLYLSIYIYRVKYSDTFDTHKRKGKFHTITSYEGPEAE